MYTAVHSQNAVSAYFTNKQILPSGFVAVHTCGVFSFPVQRALARWRARGSTLYVCWVRAPSVRCIWGSVTDSNQTRTSPWSPSSPWRMSTWRTPGRPLTGRLRSSPLSSTTTSSPSTASPWMRSLCSWFLSTWKTEISIIFSGWSSHFLSHSQGNVALSCCHYGLSSPYKEYSVQVRYSTP